MKKLQRFALLFLAISTVSLTACKDDDDDTPMETNTMKISGKNFFMTDFNETTNGTTTGSFADIDSCIKDNFIRFEVNGSAKSDEGIIKCDPSDPQTELFLWSFLESETKLRLDYGVDGADTLNIVTNNGTTLSVREVGMYDNDGDGVKETAYVTTVTFTAI